MNKKRELVSKVIEALEKAHVVLDDGIDLRAAGYFWRQYPQGHCNDMAVPSVEGALSCLTVENLEAILALESPKDGITYGELWKEWGRQGCFKCNWEILPLPEVPVLRIRHDSYLSYFRGYRFQNSYDAYGNGSNGESNGDLQQCVDFCRRVTHRDFLEECHDMTQEEIAVLCTGLVYSYPFEACRGKTTFYKALQNNPAVFDRFMLDAAYLGMRLRLDSRVTLGALRRKMAEASPRGTFELELPIVDDGNQIASLRLYSEAVQLRWRRDGEYHAYTLCFPKYTYELADSEEALCYYMWDRLSITLFTLAGFAPNRGRIMLQHGVKCDTNPNPFAPATDCIGSLDELYARCRQHLGLMH